VAKIVANEIGLGATSIAMNMTEDQIRNIILTVEKENSELLRGFGAMLFEQIMVQKYNKLKRNI
jgi:hypothetical protein